MMSKISKIPSSDASDSLGDYDLNPSSRGKYYEQYQALKEKIPVTIKTSEGAKNVILHTIKTKAILDSKGRLTADIVSDLVFGEYEVTLIIEEPNHPI